MWPPAASASRSFSAMPCRTPCRHITTWRLARPQAPPSSPSERSTLQGDPMNLLPEGPEAVDHDRYLTTKGQAWFAFALTFTLMLFDYIDRQVIVSLFPHIKSEWNLS